VIVGHLAIAAAIMLAIGRVTKSWWAGAFAAAAWAISREIAQAEYRWIETFGEGRRANMPWWGGFDPAVWTTLDQTLDWAAPTLLVFALAALASRKA